MIEQWEKFVKKHNVIFEGLGLFLNKYTIKVHENDWGFIKSPRKVPQTVLGKFKFELAKLKKSQIIERVEQPKEWSSNLVVVQKLDNSLELQFQTRFKRVE